MLCSVATFGEASVLLHYWVKTFPIKWVEHITRIYFQSTGNNTRDLNQIPFVSLQYLQGWPLKLVANSLDVPWSVRNQLQSPVLILCFERREVRPITGHEGPTGE